MSQPAENVTEAAIAAAAEVKAGKPQLPPQRLKPAEEVRVRWRVVAPVGVQPQSILDEHYWAHVAAKLHVGDIIEVVSDDGSFYLELLVRGCGKLWANVGPLRSVGFGTTGTRPAQPSPYRFEFNGSHEKWRVIRGHDVLKSGFETEAKARQWAANHQAALTR